MAVKKQGQNIQSLVDYEDPSSQQYSGKKLVKKTNHLPAQKEYEEKEDIPYYFDRFMTNAHPANYLPSFMI